MCLKILLCVISTLFGYVATFFVWVWGTSLRFGRANADNTPQQSVLGMLGLLISIPGALLALCVALYVLRTRSVVRQHDKNATCTITSEPDSGS